MFSIYYIHVLHISKGVPVKGTVVCTLTSIIILFSHLTLTKQWLTVFMKNVLFHYE